MPDTNEKNGAVDETSASNEGEGAASREGSTGEAERRRPLPRWTRSPRRRPRPLRFKEQWMRSAADFDNFRKRSRKELEDTRKAGREELLKDLLPVFDNLERAMTSAERATDVKPVSDGLKMVLRQFTDTLGRVGHHEGPDRRQPVRPRPPRGDPAGRDRRAPARNGGGRGAARIPSGRPARSRRDGGRREAQAALPTAARSPPKARSPMLDSMGLGQ